LIHQLEERYESEAEIRESGLRSDLDAKNVEIEDLKMQIAQLEASFARRGRDVESLQREKAGILAQLENVPMSDRNLGGGAATLANMERLKDMQEKVRFYYVYLGGGRTQMEGVGAMGARQSIVPVMSVPLTSKCRLLRSLGIS
jgi:hypothetical protein